MFGTKRNVDNRVFLLGLDYLYRNAMKSHETSELLPCARRVAETLGVQTEDIPVEGYYTETPELTEYFHLIRTLQQVKESSKPKVASLSEFERLLEVVSSPIFGRSIEEGLLLPAGQDPLSQALEDSKPNWTKKSLVSLSYQIAQEWDDYSLVGLAARSKDEVVLAATRESVVLYARMIVGSARRKPKYLWDVDKDLSEAAARFIGTFNSLFDDNLPLPKKKNARAYWDAYKDNDIFGRCVRIGWDDSKNPPVHYHWAIYREGDLKVHDFWNPELWTTQRYRDALEENPGKPRL